MLTVILCHKCSGLLTTTEDPIGKQLNVCQCLSGYVRGFETPQTIPQAIQVQYAAELRWLNLKETQGQGLCNWNNIGNIEHNVERLTNCVKLAKQYLQSQQGQ